MPNGQERNWLFIYSQDATTTTKPLVTASIVHLLNPQLAQSRSAHDAWLDCYVERSFREWILPSLRREFFISDNTIDRLEFCMACGLGLRLSLRRYPPIGAYITEFICAVPRFCDYLSIPDEYTAYRNFACCERFFGLLLSQKFVSGTKEVGNPTMTIASCIHFRCSLLSIWSL